MKTADEIENATKNIRYYADRIEALTQEQFNFDCDNCAAIPEMTNRLDLLCALAGATRGIVLLCGQITNNLQHAKEIKLQIRIEPDEIEQEALL